MKNCGMKTTNGTTTLRELEIGDTFHLVEFGKRRSFVKLNTWGELLGYMNCKGQDGRQYHIHPGTEVVKV